MQDDAFAALPAGSLSARAETVAWRGSFIDLYRDGFAEMVRMATLLVGSEDTARDLVQDAFVRVHRKWDSIDAPRAYLRRSVVNACTSHHRRRFLERRHAPTETETSVLEPDELFDALEKLPARQRTALVLRYYSDLPEAEIAAAMGCRRGTVASLIHRGLASLREVIEP